MDKIIIKDLHIFAYHGVNPEEKADGQNFYLDIVCSLPLEKPSVTDDLGDTVSYAKIAKLAVRLFTEEKYDLIEKAAGVVADGIISEFPAVEAVTVTVRKPEAPVKAEFAYMAVEIGRTR